MPSSTMRVLVVGAGGIGGYFGGRLLQAGRDVTFLVRPRRQEQLRKTGLVIRSPHGDFKFENPPTVTAQSMHGAADLLLLSCKAYDLDDAINSIAPAVDAATLILPVLNGMRHMDLLDARFGKERVLGGQCFISSALDESGRVMHMNENHTLTFGPRTPAQERRAGAVLDTLSNAIFDARLSPDIEHEMWEKWVFIATLAGITCLMRASVGDINRSGGYELSMTLMAEASAITARQGFPMRQPAFDRSRKMLTGTESTLKASMLRDMERGLRTEGEHILGDLVRRGEGLLRPDALLRAAYVHALAYEASRNRTST